MPEILLRTVEERDVDAVAKLYHAVYGDDFPFKEFYDTAWIKRGVFDSRMRWFVALVDGEVLGSAAVMLNAGDHDDLVAEVGRLVVHPKSRGLGLGTKLVTAVSEAAGRFSDFAFAECRTAHRGAQKIFKRQGYAITGVAPLAYDVGGRESVVFVCKLSRNARLLRRNNPTVTPEVYPLATLALHACELDVDVTADASVAPYPVDRSDDLSVSPLEDHEVYRLLRLNRHGILSPEVFGAVRLAYGFLKVKAHAARFLVLRRGDAVLGGLGYTWDDVDAKVRIFELTAPDPVARGTLLERGIQAIEQTHDPAYIGIDVSAHAPQIQRTLGLLGFGPIAYAPSMVFSLGERLDVVRMVKLRVPPQLEAWQLTEASRPAADMVLDTMRRSARGIALDTLARGSELFAGLNDVQIAQIAQRCRLERYASGAPIFSEGDDDQALYLLADGAVELARDGAPLETLSPGALFGELALVDRGPRTTSARATAATEVHAIAPDDFDAIVAADGAIGSVVYRNIARALADRLRR